MSTLSHLLFDHLQSTLIHGLNSPVSYATLFFTASDFTFTAGHIHNCVLFLLWLSLFIPSGVIFPLFSSSILGTYWPGKFIFQCHIFLPLHCSWGSQGKNTEVVCHSLLQGTMFSQNSPPWHIHLGWPTWHGSWFHWVRQGCGSCNQFG